MNKSELVSRVADKADLSKAEAARAVDAIFSTNDGVIVTALNQGDRVQVTGFGTFECRERGARIGRNPRTGEAIKIAASRNPAFRAGRSLKDAIS